MVLIALLVIGEEKIGELIGRSLEPIQAWNEKGWGNTEINMDNIWERMKGS